jgi:hypothetical protein
MVDCAGRLLRNEGPLAFYKGTLTPLLGIGACVSIQFGALEYAKRLFAARNATAGRGGEGGRDLSGGQLLLSGVAAGLANSVVSGPVEHIRIRPLPCPPTHSFLRTHRLPFLFQVYKLSPRRRRLMQAPLTPCARSGPPMALRGSSRARSQRYGARHQGTVYTSGRTSGLCSENSVFMGRGERISVRRRLCCSVRRRDTRSVLLSSYFPPLWLLLLPLLRVWMRP